MAEKCSALAREGHTAPQAASGLPLKHNLITDASFFLASGGEDGKAWPERQQAAKTCSAQWHRHGREAGGWGRATGYLL